MKQPEFVAVLDEDRFCRKCGANLCGRAIVREPHYRMYVILCTSCGRRAAVQDQPPLRLWRETWLATFTAGWVLLLAVTLIVGSSLLFGLSVGTSDVARFPYSEKLRDQYERWYTANVDAMKMITDPVEPRRRWLRSVDPDALLAAEGGWWNAMDKDALYFWIPLGLWGLAVGAILASLTPRLARPGLFVLTLIVLGCLMIPTIIYLRIESDWLENGSWWQLADVQVGVPVLLMSLAFAVVCVAAGLRFGRPAVRGLARLLLPPRMRSTLTFLWTDAGLPPPR